MRWTGQQKRRVAAVASVCAVVTVLAALLYFSKSARAGDRPLYFLPPNGERIVYLAPKPGAQMVDLPVSKNDLAGNGIVVTDEASTFVNTASSSPGVEAVIIHKTRLAEVDPVWLKNLYDHQVVVAAVNVSLHDLGGFIGDGSISNDPAYTDGWQKEPFYSIIVWRSRGQPGTPSYGTDMIRSTDNIQGIAGTDIFLSLVRRNVQLLRGLQTYPAPPTP